MHYLTRNERSAMDEGKEEATDQVVNLASSLIPATRDRQGNRERERKGVKTDGNSKETTSCRQSRSDGRPVTPSTFRLSFPPISCESATLSIFLELRR